MKKFRFNLNPLSVTNMLSLSAKYDELDDFSWHKFHGSRGVKIVQRSHTRTIAQNDVYGIRAARSGNFYVVLPDLYHVNFAITQKEANKLLENSKKVKRPAIKNLSGQDGKIIRVVNKQSDNRAWDAAYFKAARAINAEAKEGVNFANYQWRRVGDPSGFTVKKSDKKVHYKRGDVFGIRFIKPATGGVLIDQNFNRFAINLDTYDIILSMTTVLPKNKWPEGGFTRADMENSVEEERLREKEKKARQRQLIREREAVVKRKQLQELSEKKAAERQRRKQEAEDAKAHLQTLEEHMIKVRKSQTVKMSDKDIAKQIKRRRLINAEDLGLRVDHLADDEDFELNLDLDNLQIEGEFNKKDEPEREAKKVEVAEMFDQVISDLKKTMPKPKLDLSQFAEKEEAVDELEADDEVEYESDEGQEDQEEDFEDDAPEEPEEELVEEEDPVDLDTDDSEVDSAIKELEEPEVKKVVKDFEEGFVVKFNNDRSEQREFLIFDIANMEGSDHIVIYKLYDLTNEPDDYRTVRVDKRQKRRLEDMAEFVRKLPVRQLIEKQSLADTLIKNKEPIES